MFDRVKMICPNCGSKQLRVLGAGNFGSEVIPQVENWYVCISHHCLECDQTDLKFVCVQALWNCLVDLCNNESMVAKRVLAEQGLTPSRWKSWVGGAAVSAETRLKRCGQVVRAFRSALGTTWQEMDYVNRRAVTRKELRFDSRNWAVGRAISYAFLRHPNKGILENDILAYAALDISATEQASLSKKHSR